MTFNGTDAVFTRRARDLMLQNMKPLGPGVPITDIIGAAGQQDDLKSLRCRNVGRSGIVTNKNITNIKQYRQVFESRPSAQIDHVYGVDL